MPLLPNQLLKLSIIFLLFGCNSKAEKEPTNYFFLDSKRSGTVGPDTIDVESFSKLIEVDTILEATELFLYYKKSHTIKMYKTIPKGIDGGMIYYKLDDLGIIYYRSAVWNNYGRLVSNNDSINELIIAAYGIIINKGSLHCYNCRNVKSSNDSK